MLFYSVFPVLNSLWLNITGLGTMLESLPFLLIHISSNLTFAVWRLTIEGDSMVLSEQSGSHCCLFVPNPFLKTHRFQDRSFWLEIAAGYLDTFLAILSTEWWEKMRTPGAAPWGAKEFMWKRWHLCKCCTSFEKNASLLKQFLMFLTKRTVTAPQVSKLKS